MIYPSIDEHAEIGELFVENDKYSHYVTPRKEVFVKKSLGFIIDRKRRCYVDVFVSENLWRKNPHRDEMIQDFSVKRSAWFFTYGTRVIDK